MLAFVPAAISELLKRFPSTEGFLWVKHLCEFFIKKRHEHILRILHFLSLRYSADFGRSRLVQNYLNSTIAETELKVITQRFSHIYKPML